MLTPLALTPLGAGPRADRLPYAANLALWLRADLGTYQDTAATTPAASDGDPVARWNDQSGAGLSAQQGASGARPVLKLNILNGRPVLRFDGSNDRLQVASIGLPAHFTLFLVIDANTQNMLVEHSPDLNSYDGFYLYGQNFHASAVRRGAVPANLNSVNVSPGWPTANWSIIVQRFDGAHLLRRNGSTLSTTVTNSGSISNTTLNDSLNLCARSGGSLASSADVAELVIYAEALAAANYQAVESYLNGKYAIY